jgi:tRNA modification GTPase
MADADLVLLLLDATAAIDSEGVLRLPEEDARLLASLEGRSPVLVLNKIDLARPESLATVVGDLAQVSALTGEGVAELRAQVLERLRGSGSSAGNHAEGGMLTSLRHYEALAGCIQALGRARGGLAERVPHEMLLLDLYAALQQLDQLTGATTADDILNRIFSSFCIGK